MFLHLSVILFTVGVHPLGHTLLADTPSPLGRHPLGGRPPQADNPLKTATEEGGTHATGMHSYLITCLIIIIPHSHFGRCLLFTAKHLGRLCNLTKDIRVSGDHN